MTVQVYNFEQLRATVEESVSDFHEKLAGGKLDPAEIDKLLTTLLTERKMLLDEVDNLKDSQLTHIHNIYRHLDRTTLVIDEMNESTYNDFCIASYKLGITTGKALTLLMKEALKDDSDEFPKMSVLNLVTDEMAKIRISGHRYLAISGKDLIETGARVSFENIEYLDIKDADKQVFSKYVRSISRCAYVKLPSSIPKLLVYTKSHACGFFEFSDD